MKIWFVERERNNWTTKFIVVQSHQTYIHYLDQPSQEFYQSLLNCESKQLLQTLQGEQPSSKPYKPKCFLYLQLNKSSYKKNVINDHYMIRLHNVSTSPSRDRAYVGIKKEESPPIIFVEV